MHVPVLTTCSGHLAAGADTIKEGVNSIQFWLHKKRTSKLSNVFLV